MWRQRCLCVWSIAACLASAATLDCLRIACRQSRCHRRAAALRCPRIAEEGEITDALSCEVCKSLMSSYLRHYSKPSSWLLIGASLDFCILYNVDSSIAYSSFNSSKYFKMPILLLYFQVMICVASGWLATAAILAPLAVAQPPLAYNYGLGGCAPDCGAGSSALAFCILYAVLTLLLPAFLVLICSLKILRIARYHRHRIAAAIYEVTLSAQVTVTHQRNPFTPPPPPRRRALSAVLQPLGSLAILYFPYYCVLIWPAITMPPPQLLAAISAALLAAAPPVNGIMYGVRSRALRESLRNYRRKRMTKSEVTQEIQARTPSACGSRRPSLSVGSGSIRPPTTRRLSDAAAMGMRGSERPAPRAASCNMLQDPQQEEPPPRLRTSAIPWIRAPPHVVLGRALGLEDSLSARDRRRRQSPRITVTRAMSDESDSPTRRPLCRQQSRSSGALLFGLTYSPVISETIHLDQAEADEQVLLSWPRQRPHDKQNAL